VAPAEGGQAQRVGPHPNVPLTTVDSDLNRGYLQYISQVLLAVMCNADGACLARLEDRLQASPCSLPRGLRAINEWTTGRTGETARIMSQKQVDCFHVELF